MYRVVMTVDGKQLAQGLSVEPDPTGATTIAAPEDEEDEERDR
jgi:hypothetical protein